MTHASRSCRSQSRRTGKVVGSIRLTPPDCLSTSNSGTTPRSIAGPAGLCLSQIASVGSRIGLQSSCGKDSHDNASVRAVTRLTGVRRTRMFGSSCGPSERSHIQCTVTQVLDRSEPDALRDHFGPLGAAVARFRHSEPAVLPPGQARPIRSSWPRMRGISSTARATTSWSSRPTTARTCAQSATGIRRRGRCEGADAQRAFWGFESPRQSMLRHFAGGGAAPARAR